MSAEKPFDLSLSKLELNLVWACLKHGEESLVKIPGVVNPVNSIRELIENEIKVSQDALDDINIVLSLDNADQIGTAIIFMIRDAGYAKSLPGVKDKVIGSMRMSQIYNSIPILIDVKRRLSTAKALAKYEARISALEKVILSRSD